MSKSSCSERSRISIIETKEAINWKITKALSDMQPNITFDPEERPAISNLVKDLYVDVMYVRYTYSWVQAYIGRSV